MKRGKEGEQERKERTQREKQWKGSGWKGKKINEIVELNLKISRKYSILNDKNRSEKINKKRKGYKKLNNISRRKCECNHLTLLRCKDYNYATISFCAIGNNS